MKLWDRQTDGLTDETLRVRGATCINDVLLTSSTSAFHLWRQQQQPVMVKETTWNYRNYLALAYGMTSLGMCGKIPKALDNNFTLSPIRKRFPPEILQLDRNTSFVLKTTEEFNVFNLCTECYAATAACSPALWLAVRHPAELFAMTARPLRPETRLE